MARSTRPAMRRVASGQADSLTPFIVLALLALLGVTGYFQQRAGVSATIAWTEAGVRAAMFFAIVAPLVLLGIFALSKILNFQLTGGTYLRAAAIAAVPILAMLTASLMPENGVVRLLLVMGSIPLAAALARGLFDLSLIEAGACVGICLPLFLAGMGISRKVTTLARGEADNAVGQVAAAINQATSSASASPQRTPSRAANVDPVQRQLNSLADRADALGGDAMASMTREQFAEQLATLQTELASLKANTATSGEWQRISAQLRDLAPRGSALPSEKPDDSVYLAAAATQNWSNVALSGSGSDASFGPFNLRLPADARLDLSTSDPAAPTLRWTWRGSWSTLVLRMAPAPDARQQRPWVVTRGMMQRLSSRPSLYVLQSDRPDMTMGNLADAVFFRVAGFGNSGDDIIYCAHVDGKWIEALISSPAGSEARAAFESAVKTLRRRSASESPSDPLAPTELVKRLADDPQTAVTLLKKQGSAAESALLAALSTNDARLKARVLDVLAETATADAIEPLRPLAESSDPEIQKLAITALRRLSPREYDEVGVAALMLKRGNDAEKRTALQTLASATRETGRPQVTREIETIVLAESPALSEPAVAALAVWADSQTIPRLIPWLAQNASLNRRKAAMAILPATKDPAAVLPMLNWVIQMPEDVVKAVIAMGPVAEDEVIKHLFTNLDNNRNTVARTSGTRILGEIGTLKSLPVLQRASNDPRDATAAAIAKIELEKVRARVLPNRGGPTTRAGRGS